MNLSHRGRTEGTRQREVLTQQNRCGQLIHREPHRLIRGFADQSADPKLSELHYKWNQNIARDWLTVQPNSTQGANPVNALTVFQRRKMLRNTMKPFFSDENLMDDPFFTKRPEALGWQEFVDLTRRVS